MSQYYCVTDKHSDESHSFVDGMLLSELGKSGVRVLVVVARGPSAGVSSGQAQKEGLVIAPFERKGLGRILYPAWAVGRFIKSCGRGIGSSVFVRNEILCLSLFALLKGVGFGKFRLRFQSSFPHEYFSGSSLHRRFARSLLRFALPHVDVVYVVSEAAIPRVVSLGATGRVRVIPLCVDLPTRKSLPPPLGTGEVTRFVYIGSCSKLRRHDIVLDAAYLAMAHGAKFSLDYFGVTKDQLVRLLPHSAHTIETLVQLRRLKLHGSVPRCEIPRFLREFHVGINIMPFVDLFKESSATKIGEYLSQGLPVLITAGIPFHESVLKYGNIGWAVKWDRKALADCFYELSTSGRPDFSAMAEECINVCREHLNYSAYVGEMLE